MVEIGEVHVSEPLGDVVSDRDAIEDVEAIDEAIDDDIQELEQVVVFYFSG